MEIVQSSDGAFLGVDAGKAKHVVELKDCEGKTLRRSSFFNNVEGMERLRVWLGPDIARLKVVLEATSRYHRLCERTLLDAGAEVLILNPRRARALAIGLGVRDKDDKVDAGVLADAARLIKAKNEKVHSLLAQDLRDHSRIIAQLKEDIGKYKKRLDGLSEDSLAYKTAQSTIKSLEKQAKEAEENWSKSAAEEPEIWRRYQLALSVRDVGKATARVVSVELPADLDSRRNRQLVAYSGTVPRRSQSGQMTLPPRIDGGNPHLRTALYMAAFNSIHNSKRHHPFFYALMQRKQVLVSTPGGRYLKAIVAVMRKLLSEIIAVIKRNRPWTEEPPTYGAVSAARESITEAPLLAVT